MVNFSKNAIVSIVVNIIVDAVQVIRDVLRNPKSSQERKRKHFANVALSEVYFEATPTVFLYTMLMQYLSSGGRNNNYSQNSKAFQVLYGENSTKTVLFLISFSLSLLSAAFGIAR